MGYASRSGRARTNAKAPRAFAVCQRCSIWYNRDQLRFQYQWRGAALLNTYILVCEKCLDIPTEQNRAIVLPADPVPVFYPSVEDFANAESDYRAVSLGTPTDARTGLPIPSTTLRVTENCQNRTLNPLGKPVGVGDAGVLPNFIDGVTYGRELAVLSVVSNGTATVTVTCSAVHGLHTPDQVSALGLALAAANGLFNVTVTTATQFTYQTVPLIPSQNLLTAGTLIRTAKIGGPLGYCTLPLPGGTVPPVFTPAPPVTSGQPIQTDSGIDITTDSGVQITTD